MEELIQLDKELFLFLNNLGTPTWDAFWLFMTEKLYQAPLFLIVLYFFYKHFGLKGTLVTLVVVAALIAVSDQLSNLFKNVLFMRPRPCRADGVAELTRFIAERCGRHGYFSAHASTSMALAFFIGLSLQKHIKYIFLILVIWSITFSYSRIYLGVHYPGDIITGMSIGVLLGLGAYKLHGYLIARYAATT